jgi:sulfur carrier protein
MRITVNGEAVTAPDGAVVAEVLAGFLADRPGGDRGIAVALDGEVVPRSRWESEVVADGQRIEVVTAAAGG